jgi:hypothetical protein
MRANWWTIARLELTLAFRDKEAVIWSLIAPIVMAAIFGAMFGGGNAAPAPTRVTLAASANPPAVAQWFGGALEARGFAVADDGMRVAIPDSLVPRLRRGEDVTASITKTEESDFRVMSVNAAVREILFYGAFHTDEIAAGAAADQTGGRLALDVSTLGARPTVPRGASRTLPQMLVMFIMFQLTTFFMLLWIDDLNTGKTKRIVMSPTTTRDILFGNLVARVLWSAMQVIVILGVGSLVLNVRMDAPALPLAAVIAAYMLAAVSLGLLLGTLFKTTEKANAIGVIAGLVLAALGGCWWPLEIVPAPMRAVALMLPTGQAMDAIGELNALGTAAPFPLRNILVLLAWRR